MRPDPSAWLGTLEPEKPRNARSWDGSAGSGAIVPPSEIRNAASLDDARRASGLNPHLAQREDTREAFVAGRVARERSEQAPVEAPKEAPVPKHNPNAPKPSDVRRYLLEHGPTERDTLLDEVGFRKAYKNESTARTMLNKCLREIGASGGRGPARLPDDEEDERPAPAGLTARQERLRGLILKARDRGGAADVTNLDGDYVGGASNPEFTADLKAIGAVPVGSRSFTIDPPKIVNTIGAAAVDFDALLAELSEASVDLDRALVRVEKAKAAVKEAAGR